MTLLEIPAPVSGDTFREAMALLASPVSVITTRDALGRPWGFTASSVTSVSLDPPLVQVGVANDSSCLEAMTGSPEFLINVLGEQHTELARRFASKGVDRFAGYEFDDYPGTGLPCLADANAVYRCTTADRIPVGDHVLLVGELTGLRTPGTARPLLWYQRGFRSVSELAAGART